MHDFATKIRTLPTVQVETLLDETLSEGRLDPARVPAVATIEDALDELDNAT